MNAKRGLGATNEEKEGGGASAMIPQSNLIYKKVLQQHL